VRAEMNNLKEKDPTIRFWNNLFESLGESEGQTKEEIIEELKEDGIDVERVIANVKKFIQMKKDEQRLAWQKKAREEREKKLKLLKDLKSNINSEERIKQILTENTSLTENQIAIFYKRFKTLSEKDKESVIEDELLLDLLETIEKEEK